jgi:uncharacterized phage protein gp47/JayE
MAELQQANGQTVIDYMARDYDSFLQSMRSLIPSKLPEWTDHQSEADFGNVLLQLFAHMGDILSYYQDRVANESFLGTAQTRRSIIHHLRLIGYKLSTAAPASASLALIMPATSTDVITIKKGDAFSTKSEKDKPSVRFEYTREASLVIDFATIAVDPVTNKKIYKKDTALGTEGIPVEEGKLYKDELLGTSDGTANQSFKLVHSGLILRSLGESNTINRDIIIYTELGGVFDEWTPRESLAFSRESQKDYAIDIDENDVATILFGDGAFGAIPPSGSVIRVSYRVGGGTKGNVAAESIQTIADAPQITLLGGKVTNPDPAVGGAERESIEHAVMHAPSVFRSLKRAVTAADYKALALKFTGVGKVRAEATSWNTVSLFVAPQGGGQVSDILRSNLISYFEDKRPLSTIIEIEDVDYVKIYVTAEVTVTSYYSKEDIKEKVKEAAGSLLEFDNVDFGTPLYLSKFYEAIEGIAGVEFVNIIQFEREETIVANDPHVQSSGKIALNSSEIPIMPGPDQPDYGGGIKVNVTGGY